MNALFLQDTIEGLSQPHKRLSSKYFYDEIGDRLFQEIMQLEEYYLPSSELEILNQQTTQIAAAFGNLVHFDIVELGAGDGSKTAHFLKQLLEMGKKITYYPLDISASILQINKKNLLAQMPDLDIVPLQGDYFQTLHQLQSQQPKVILFMGSNIGNYANDKALDFLKILYRAMLPNDFFMLGVDLKKNPKTILAAYDDRKGVTKEFNLNLLRRMNRELNANFDLEAFDHYPFYEPLSGIAYSYIVSLKQQAVQVAGHTIYFEKDELIHTEVSQKYSLSQLDNICEALNFESVQHFLDQKAYYAISVFKK